MIQVAALIGWISWRTIWFFVELPAPVILLLVALACAAWKVLYRPFPLLETNPLLDLVAYHTPTSTSGWSGATTSLPLS